MLRRGVEQGYRDPPAFENTLETQVSIWVGSARVQHTQIWLKCKRNCTDFHKAAPAIFHLLCARSTGLYGLLEKPL